MMVINWQQFLKYGLPMGQRKTSVTIGIFDGVHRGHQALIKRIVEYNPDYYPMVITFRENRKVKKHTDNIQTFQEKIAVLKNLDVKILLTIDFTNSFMRMPGIEFLNILLKRGRIGFLAVGNNFRCGYRLDTDAVLIKKVFASCNIPVEIIPEVMEGNIPISSSRIRCALSKGDISLAQAMLGRGCNH